MRATEATLPPLLGFIAGMVDLIGFLTLGNLFTAHITGNLVVIAALIVRGGPVNVAQVLSIPVFILVVAALWYVVRASDTHGYGVEGVLLLIQFLLLICVLTCSVITKPSGNPRGLMAGVAAMLAVSAMACQVVLFRLVFPSSPSTAFMTGNLTNTVLALLGTLLPEPNGGRLQSNSNAPTQPLKSSFHVLIAFFGGCVGAAAAVSFLGDWAWSCPVVGAGAAFAIQKSSRRPKA